MPTDRWRIVTVKGDVDKEFAATLIGGHVAAGWRPFVCVDRESAAAWYRSLGEHALRSGWPAGEASSRTLVVHPPDWPRPEGLYVILLDPKVGPELVASILEEAFPGWSFDDLPPADTYAFAGDATLIFTAIERMRELGLAGITQSN